MLSCLEELVFLFLKLGAIGFGGPAVQIARREDESSVRSLLSRKHFLDLVSATNLIPDSLGRHISPAGSGLTRRALVQDG